ncbi:MAG TPA: hypothetical protein VK593_07960 [Edaphobacter sp.]|nr:hypothetical protein [Edaphobacter sp.]
MSLRNFGCVLFVNLCGVLLATGQTPVAPQNARVSPAPDANTQVQALSIRGVGMSDDVITTNCLAFVTALSIKNNVITFHGPNHLAASAQIRLSQLNNAPYLNNVILTVSSATPVSFSAAFSHADVPYTNDGGTAFRTDCPAKTGFRSDQKIEVFHNDLSYYRRRLSPDVKLSTFDSFVPLLLNGHYTSSTYSTPSYSWGNQGGWGVRQNQHDEVTFNSRGIDQARAMICVKHGTGDTACGDYIYGYTDGGSTAQSDEGFTVDTREGGESDKYFHGKVGEGAKTGATSLPVVFTSGQEATTDGAFLLDISKGTISGTVVGMDAIVDDTSVHTLPVSVTGGAQLPVSTGVGVIRTPLPIIAIANISESITLDVSLTRGAFKKGVACLAGGWYPEQVMVTSVESPQGGSQKVTLTHKNPNPTASTDPHNPSSLWQGGLCGNYMSLDRNLARDGFRTSYQVVGATDTSHLAYVWNVNGSVRQNGLKLYGPPAGLNKLVRKGGVVTANFARPAPYLYNQAPSVVISGATDSSLNGTVSTPTYTNGRNLSLSWKQAGPDATAPSATIDLPAESYGFHLYPGAEVLEPGKAGEVSLEPNAVAWTAGDVIENPHNPSFQMRFRMSDVVQHTLPSGADSHAELWRFAGAGISANYRPSRWVNNNPCKMYVGCGGTLDPITWTNHRGPYAILQRVDNAPLNAGALFMVGCSLQGCDHPAPYSLFELQNGRILYDPATSTVSTAVFQAETLSTKKLSVEQVSFPSVADSSCVGIVNHVLVAGGSCAGGAGTGPAAASSVTATMVVGDANRGGSATCASGYRCTVDRGRISLVASTGTSAGRVARVNTKLATGAICTATQNGGTAFFGIGSGGEGSTGFDITSGVAISGRITIDYACH